MDLWFTEYHTKDSRFSIKIDKPVISLESEFQRIDVFDSYDFGRVLVLDGYLMFTEKDEFIYHEMITHIPYGCKSGNPRCSCCWGRRWWSGERAYKI